VRALCGSARRLAHRGRLRRAVARQGKLTGGTAPSPGKASSPSSSSGWL
jgi:hypothetical protein